MTNTYVFVSWKYDFVKKLVGYFDSGVCKTSGSAYFIEQGNVIINNNNMVIEMTIWKNSICWP